MMIRVKRTNDISPGEIGEMAVEALLAEANLTPKPGLVDRRDTGSHEDMTLEMLQRSARALQPYFIKMAETAQGRDPSQELREELAEIGREAERAMYAVTNDINTHKGAIWALGLLLSTYVMDKFSEQRVKGWMSLTAQVARYPDRGDRTKGKTNGAYVRKKYGVGGARSEAEDGFPHVLAIGLPTLLSAREKDLDERSAQLHVLLAIMAELPDTCILHRGGYVSLAIAQNGARTFLENGGVTSNDGWDELEKLNETMIELGVSPGGSADLLAATIFIDRLLQRNKK